VTAGGDRRGRSAQPESSLIWPGEHVDAATEAVSAALEVLRSNESSHLEWAGRAVSISPRRLRQREGVSPSCAEGLARAAASRPPAGSQNGTGRKLGEGPTARLCRRHPTCGLACGPPWPRVGARGSGAVYARSMECGRDARRAMSLPRQPVFKARPGWVGVGPGERRRPQEPDRGSEQRNEHSHFRIGRLRDPCVRH